MERVELAFQQRLIPQSKLYRNIVKPAGCEAAIEMPQSWNDHSDDRDLDVGARLIENEEVEARLLGETHADAHLFVRSETAELRAEVQRSRAIVVAWRQERMVLQPEWSGAVKGRFVRLSASHETDGEELVQLRQRAQGGDSRVEVGAGPELDIFLPVIDPVRHRDECWNPEIAGDVEHPKPTSDFGKLHLQIAEVGIVELAEIHLRPLQSVVPPD